MWLGSRYTHLLWIALGLLVGIPLGMMLLGVPLQAPLHAMATDRFDTFAVCTGAVDDNVEAIYFLDFLTGKLRAAVISSSPQGKGNASGNFAAFFERDVLTDMGVDPSKNPRFMMVTGMARIKAQAGGSARPSSALVYVAEITSGLVIAYAIPWQQGVTASGYKATLGTLVPMARTPFRDATQVRGAPAAGGSK